MGLWPHLMTLFDTVAHIKNRFSSVFLTSWVAFLMPEMDCAYCGGSCGILALYGGGVLS